MKILIEKQVEIILSLQRILLAELDRKDVNNKPNVDFFNNQIKIAIEGLDVLECLPDETDEIDEEIDEDED